MKRRFTKYPSNYVRASFMFTDEHPIATEGEWEMWEPATFDAMRQLASGTRWATAYDKYYFDTYMNYGPLYVFINNTTGEKYMSNPESKSWLYDADDRSLGKQALIDFLDSHPKFADVFAAAGYDFFYVTTDTPSEEDFTPRFASDFRE